MMYEIDVELSDGMIYHTIYFLSLSLSLRCVTFSAIEYKFADQV